MPIEITDRWGNVKVEDVGRVVEVRRYRDRRNVSDTLDYSDYQDVSVVEALVYRGRTQTKHEFVAGVGYTATGETERPLDKRFELVDCSNLFVWRGQEPKNPVEDPREEWVAGMAEDLEAWKRMLEEQARVAAERHAAWEREQKAKEAEAERNRPVVGKRMVVARGRKVPVGTEGTVAYVHSSGRALLKKDDEWQDRKADGVWVDARNLRPR